MFARDEALVLKMIAILCIIHVRAWRKIKTEIYVQDPKTQNFLNFGKFRILP